MLNLNTLQILVTSASVVVASPLVFAEEANSRETTTMATGVIPQANPDAVPRPKFVPLLRQNEDWSALRPPAIITPPLVFEEFLGNYKHLPIGNDRGYLSFGGSFRTRLEAFSNFNFGAAPPGVDTDSIYLLTRFRLHTDLHVNDRLRFFVEVKSALSTDRDLPGGARRTLDADELELQQAFVDVVLVPDETDLTLRVGRQQFKFGEQRLVSPLPWGNTLRHWDGVQLSGQFGDVKATGFYGQFAPVKKFSFNRSDAQNQLYGLYFEERPSDETPKADAFFFGFERGDPQTFNGTTGDEKRYTVGARVFDKLAASGIDYEFWGAYQFGELGGADIEGAYAVSANLGYTPPERTDELRIHAGFEYATGDHDTGGDVNTFNPMFPLGHAYFGFIDAVGRQNVVSLNAGASLKPTDKLSLLARGHLFWRADIDDAFYSAGGGVTRPGASSDSRYIGAELDFVAEYQIDQNWTISAGYSHFFAGNVLEDSGPSEDIDFAYLQVQWVF